VLRGTGAFCDTPETQAVYAVEDPSELLRRGTACGRTGNQAFTGDVIDLLRGIPGPVYITEIPDAERGRGTILAMLAKANSKTGRAIEKAVQEAGGSLRYDNGNIGEPLLPGYRYFESE